MVPVLVWTSVPPGALLFLTVPLLFAISVPPDALLSLTVPLLAPLTSIPPPETWQSTILPPLVAHRLPLVTVIRAISASEPVTPNRLLFAGMPLMVF